MSPGKTTQHRTAPPAHPPPRARRKRDAPAWLPEGYSVPTGVRLDFSDGYWLYIASTDEPGYEITGKYLFFAPDPIVLLTVAVDEIVNHEFHMAKVNSTLVSGTEHVLCLYFADDSRRYELRDRYRSRMDMQDLRYRWWKSDTATRRGVYSEQFLSGLESQRMGAFDKKGT